MRFPSNDDQLQLELDAYVASSPDHRCRVLGLPPGTPIRVRIDPAAVAIRQERGDSEVLLHLPRRDARQILAYCLSFTWASGVVLIPTLIELLASGAFERTAEGREVAVLDLARQHQDDPEPNLGLVWGALNLLALQGWVHLRGADRHARYSLTPIGVWVVRYVQRNYPLFERLAKAVGFLQHLHALCHRRHVDAAALAEYGRLVDLSAAGWQMAAGVGKDALRAHAQLIAAMDGLLAGPTWIALDMPLFEPEGNRIIERAPSVFARFDEENGWPEAGMPDVDPAFLAPAWRLLGRLEQIETVEVGWIRLSAWGSIIRPIAAPYAALPASYLRTYERLRDLLFGDPDPLGIDRDAHVDRVMNVYGSSGAGSGPAVREIADKIISRLFDNPDLDHQPAGLADMGCGDGSALAKLANYVVGHTLRGRHLDSHPLLVVGADYNESARARARENLAALDQVAGVLVRVLHADIGNPAAYDQAMRESGLRVRDGAGGTRPAGLRDFLHTFMFLVHNRRLRIRDEARAEEVLFVRLAAADRRILEKVAASYFPGRLTVDRQAALPLPLKAVKAAFRVAYSDTQGIVPGFVAAADLVDFMVRWKPFIVHGFLCVEGHSPCAEDLLEPIPEHAQEWMRVDELPHPFNWGMHFPSRQFMMPFDEFMLALALAGFAPRDEIYGRVHPEGFPGLDLAPEFRFFSIADYVPHDPPGVAPAGRGGAAAADLFNQVERQQ